jgi:hypothetical protein
MIVSASTLSAMTLPFGRHKDKLLAEVSEMLTDAERLREIAGRLREAIDYGRTGNSDGAMP